MDDLEIPDGQYEFSLKVKSKRKVYELMGTLFTTSSSWVSEVQPPVEGPDYTTWTEDGETVKIYVSDSDGDDADDGLSEGNAKKTIAAGYALLRDGKPDWLMLKKGDTFRPSSTLTWAKNGKSASAKMMIKSYGSGARPIWDCTANGAALYMITGADVNRNLAVVGVDFYATNRDPDHGNFESPAVGDLQYGIRILGYPDYTKKFSNIHIEDCRFRFHQIGLVIEGVENFTLRYCQIHNQYASAANGHAHGIFIHRVWGDIVIEHNALDTCGWNPTEHAGNAFSHAIYFQHHKDGTVEGTDVEGMSYTDVLANVKVENNFVSRSLDTQFRAGGTIKRNLGCYCGTAFQVGVGDNYNTVIDHGVHMVFEDNVSIYCERPVAVGWDRAANFENIASASIKRNVFANNHATRGTGIRFRNSYATHPNSNVVFEDNACYNLKETLTMESAENYSFQYINNVFDEVNVSSNWFWDLNEVTSLATHYFAGNQYNSPIAAGNWFRYNSSTYTYAAWISETGEQDSSSGASSYIAPSREPADYVDHVEQTSGSSHGDFVDKMLAQSEDSFDNNYILRKVLNYVRVGGFDMASLT